MSKLRRAVVAFCNDESGPSAVEYAIMMALIIVVCVATLTNLGNHSNIIFNYVGKQVGQTSGS